METSVIELGPLLGYVLEVLAVVLVALAGWAVKKLADKFGLENEAKLREVVMGAVQRGVNYGKNKAKEEVAEADWATVETKNKLVGHAANYVLNRVPDAVKKFNLQPEDVRDLVLAQLVDDEEPKKKLVKSK